MRNTIIYFERLYRTKKYRRLRSEMEIVKCELDDYYKDGIGIVQFLAILDALYYDQEIPAWAEIRKWELLYFKKNMWALGFFEGVPTSDSYGISPRGMSLLCCRILQKKGIISQEIETSMARYVVLKAIADIDWSCFSTILVERYVNKKRPKEIRSTYFPYDVGENFSHRWGFHRKIIEQLTLSKMVESLPSDELRKDVSKINPYCKNFKCDLFFKRKLSIPTKNLLKSTFAKSIRSYSTIFKKHVPFAYSEILKTIIQCALLSEDRFLNEPDLCVSLIEGMRLQRISLHMSSKDTKITGRGVYKRRNGEEISYPFFELPKSSIKL